MTRVVEWVERSDIQDPISDELLTFLDEECAFPGSERNFMTQMPKLNEELTNRFSKNQATVALVLLMALHVPKAVKNSVDWQTMVKVYGKEKARMLGIWFSLHSTIHQAKGLEG